MKQLGEFSVQSRTVNMLLCEQAACVTILFYSTAMSAPRPSSSEELLGDWSSELEAVLYAPEVEEAIQEVRQPGGGGREGDGKLCGPEIIVVVCVCRCVQAPTH